MSWHPHSIEEITHIVTKGTTPTTLGRQFTYSGVNFIKAEALNGDSGLDIGGFFHIDEDTHELLRRSVLQEDDVLVTIAGAQVGKCGYVKAEHLPANTNQAVGIVRINKDKAVSRFVYYFFKQPSTFALCQNIGGQAAQPNVNLTVLKSIKVPLPSLSIQKKIASILSTYDDLIENNRRRMALLEEAARQLYREWFVRLRFPGYEHTRITNGVPEGWEWKRMSDVAQCMGGGTPSTANPAYWEDGEVTWVTPTDVTRNKHFVLLDSEKKITEVGLQNSSAKLVPAYAILMTSRASVGYFAFAGREVCTNQGFISIVPREPSLSTYLLFHLSERVEEIRAMGSGSTYPEVSRGKFREFEIVIPKQALALDFDERASLLLNQIRMLKQQNEKLRAARDLLLPRLMSGEIVT